MSTLLWSTHVTNLACWRGPAASRRWLSLFVGVTLISSGVSAAVRVNGRPQDLVLDRADLHTSAVETCRLRLQALAGEGKLDRDAELIARVRGVAARVIAQAILLGSPNGERFGRSRPNRAVRVLRCFSCECRQSIRPSTASAAQFSESEYTCGIR